MRKKIIFLCGLLCDERIWATQKEFFSKHYKTEILAFPDMDNLEKMAESVLPYLYSEGNILVGHSMGARVALEVYTKAQNQIEKIALLDFGIHGVKKEEPAKRFALIQATEQYGMDYLVENWLKPMLHPEHICDEQLLSLQSDMVLNQNINSFKKQVHALLNRKAREELFQSIHIPMYLGVGRQDQWSTLPQHETMHKLNTNSQLFIYEKSGHMSPLEASQQVSDSLYYWITYSSI